MAKGHEYYTELAIELAEEAEAKGNLPVGALIVHGERIIAWATRALVDCPGALARVAKEVL